MDQIPMKGQCRFVTGGFGASAADESRRSGTPRLFDRRRGHDRVAGNGVWPGALERAVGSPGQAGPRAYCPVKPRRSTLLAGMRKPFLGGFFFLASGSVGVAATGRTPVFLSIIWMEELSMKWAAPVLGLSRIALAFPREDGWPAACWFAQ